MALFDRKRQILLTLFRKNLQALVVEAMCEEKSSLSSRTTPRFLATVDGVTTTFSIVMDRSTSGEYLAGR